MPTTTNFQNFIKNMVETDIEEVNDLYSSIETSSEMGSYNCVEENGKYFVKTNYNDLTLLLASEEAKFSFLKVLDSKFGGNVGWVSGNYDFQKELKKKE